jgi:quercetin dioxygenase-like cupin family protein
MIVRSEAAALQHPAPGLHRKLLSYQKDLMVCEVLLDKGCHVAAHSHVHSQITYVISGSCQVTTETDSALLQAGDSISFAPNETHAVFSPEDTKVLDIFSPMRDEFLD